MEDYDTLTLRVWVYTYGMGNYVSELDSVNLKDLPADVYESIVSETYTVQRNPAKVGDPKPGEPGAREEEGWIIPREPKGSWAAAHATCQNDIWKFNMINGLNDYNFVYGWRNQKTFWPTRLTTIEDREAWSSWLVSQVTLLKTPMDKLEEKRNTKT